ncbi:transglycosylase domain-containing protein [Shouchella shacheensis]|uniref:transglycosylase domain-containing protein n=1 Tax=Shouchella shacheensis TaxID=1649580 RepID=UPI000740091A|nr:PBP1A family penicillin-binding protein [Shouchella shacheensis]
MIKKIAIAGGVACGLLVSAFLIFAVVILAGHYQIDEEKLVMNNSSVLVDQEGEVITDLYMENRQVIPISEVPEHVQNAFVAIEDSRFYEHQGIDFRAIGRALYRDILAGAKVEGGSTITQQLAKNVFLSNEKAWLRKTNEVLIAMNLERRYSKDEILQMYLNQVYFGHGAYGIEAASKLYFNKSASELTVDEGAVLAGVVNAPSYYSPFEDKERSKERRDLILTVMEQQGFISADESSSYKGRVIATDRQEMTEDESLYTYIDMVMDEAEERYNISQEELLTGGYRIVVPINREMQRSTYEALQNEDYFPEGSKDAQASMMFMNAESGGIIAAQGGRDYVRRGLNRVNVKRSPGSTFKPLSVYAPALEDGQYQPYSMLRDELLQYGEDWIPKNVTGEYAGEMTLYDAIEVSANAPAVWLLNEMGVEQSLAQLSEFGFELPDRGLSLALGGLSEGVTPYEMTKSYRAFAEEGRMVEPYVIQDIYDRNDRRIGGASPIQTEVLSKQTAWSMTRMLESAVKEGTGSGGPATSSVIAGKTGTQNYDQVEGANSDAWFVGYTPDVIGTVWMGYDQTTQDQYLHGGSAYPTALFKSMVNTLPSEMQQVAFSQPEGTQDLAPPIAMEEIEDFEATYSIGGQGLLSVELTWKGFEDERIEYHVYEVEEDGERELVASNLTEPHFSQGRINPFSIPSYEVVPYDPVAKIEGEASAALDPSFSFSF